jgi:hypothetical protein
MRRARRLVLVLIAAGGAVLVYRSVAAPESGAPAPPVATDQAPAVKPAVTEHATVSVDEARHALTTLVTAERHRGGYERDLFGDDWTVSAGCTTRQHVLADEAVAGTVDPAGCDVVGGAWTDWYSADTPTYTDPSALDVDHLVPLAHAWQAGAWAWTPEQRLAFANDLTNPAALTAVSASQNRAKSDAPPDAWQPPNHAARCTYAKDWISVKTAWTLTVTIAEITALNQMLDRCDH